VTRTLPLALLNLLLTFGSFADSMGGSITYNIQNYPALQNGYTLTGTITTDGNLGIISNTDITAWNYTITQGPNIIYQETSTAHGSFVGDGSTLSATATQLTFPSQSVLSFGLALNNSSDNSTLLWELPNTIINGVSGGWYYIFYSNTLTPANLWNTNGTSANQPTTPWLIASTSVPEPASLTLALLAGGCVAVFERPRRRRLS
jgi:hypothetical protein